NGTQTASASASRPSLNDSNAFTRPDGLGPEAEPQETFGGRGPGILPPELVEQLAREGALATDEEVAAVHATTLDSDTGTGAAPYINETIDLTLHLKQSTLAPKVKENWDRYKRNLLVFWRCLNRIRAGQERQEGQQGGSAQRPRSAETGEGEDELEEVLVSEQKLVTYLNCFVLHKNPRIGDEGVETHIKAMVNLWETQTLQGHNSFPHPRDGALIKAFTKALRTGRSALAAAKLDDAWKHSLRDGYDPDEQHKISKWYLEQAVVDAQGSWARARFDFLMHHAMAFGRSAECQALLALPSLTHRCMELA
ncbi:unnamed protein product, partial [Tilletia caries]